MKVIIGDARELIKTVPSDAFIISDPPYDQGYHYATYKDDMGLEAYSEMLLAVFAGRKSVIIHYPEETIALMGGGKMGGDPAGRQLGLQLQHGETTQADNVVELPAGLQEDSPALQESYGQADSQKDFGRENLPWIRLVGNQSGEEREQERQSTSLSYPLRTG